VTGDSPVDPARTPQLTLADLPQVRDEGSYKAITGWVTCRLVDEHALLHCKRCGRGTRVLAAPRRAFLVSVREFVHEHEDCP
jgi:hypothetical protein